MEPPGGVGLGDELGEGVGDGGGVGTPVLVTALSTIMLPETTAMKSLFWINEPDVCIQMKISVHEKDNFSPPDKVRLLLRLSSRVGGTKHSHLSDLGLHLLLILDRRG
jgi:hypothetical protein